MDAKIGDFFSHPRLGTVRVIETGPDFILIQPRNGSAVRLGSFDAEKQLRPVPSNGFRVLLYQRDPDVEWLRDNIEDVIDKIMHDHHSRSLEINEIKRELSPILSRQQRNWDPWWKSARKKVLSGSRFAADSQRKGRILRTTTSTAEGAEDIFARVRELSDHRDLLQIAKEVDTFPLTERSELAKAVAERILAGLRGLNVRSQGFAELFCGLCYVVDCLAPTDGAEIFSRMPPVNFDGMSLPVGLERDLNSALAVLSRISPPQSKLLAHALLTHPSTDLAGKAFSVLNTEASRITLKTSLLLWIEGKLSDVRLELYLRKDFLKHLREADLQRVYVKILDEPALWVSPPARDFLNLRDVAEAVFKDAAADNRRRLRILGCSAVSPDLRLALAKSVAEPEALLDLILTSSDSENEAKLAMCLEGLIPPEEISSWKLLVEAVKSGSHPELFKGLCDSVAHNIIDSSDSTVMILAERASRLYELAQAEYSEAIEDIAHSLHMLGRRLQSNTAPWTSPLFQAFRTEIEKATTDLTLETDKLRGQAEETGTKLREALAEVERLRGLVEMLRSSASVDKEEVEAQLRIEAYRPILSLVDDLERQASTAVNPPVRQLISQMDSTLERAGIRRIGVPGEIRVLDPQLHELVDETPQLADQSGVQILRSGFVLETNHGRRLIRRAVVRPQ